MWLRVRVDADARIADGESGDGAHARNVYDDMSAMRRELDRVVEEIQDEPLEPFRVALHDHAVCVIASHGDPSRLGHRLDLVDERCRKRSKIDLTDPSAPALMIAESSPLSHVSGTTLFYNAQGTNTAAFTVTGTTCPASS